MSDITKVLHDVQQKLKAPKGQTNNFGKYKYRSCEDIVEAVKPLLAKHGAVLLLTDKLENIGDRYYVNANVAIVVGDETINVSAYARETETRKGMDESQITGTASSYARKYALNGLFAIDDTKDADTLKPASLDPEPADQEKVKKAAEYFKSIIDEDDLEGNHARVKSAHKRLSNNERLDMLNLLQDKAPGSKRKYKTLLGDYLDYVPTEGVMK